MIQTSRPPATNPSTSPVSASQGEVWNRLSPRSPRKKPTSGEMMSREGIASSVAALRKPDGSRLGSSGRLSCGGAMRADLRRLELLEKLFTNLGPTVLFSTADEGGGTLVEGAGRVKAEGSFSPNAPPAVGPAWAHARALEDGLLLLARATDARYGAARDSDQQHAGRGACLPPPRQALGVVADTSSAPAFSGGRMAGGDRRNRARRGGARRRHTRSARGDRARAAALVGARAPRHIL